MKKTIIVCLCVCMMSCNYRIAYSQNNKIAKVEHQLIHFLEMQQKDSVKWIIVRGITNDFEYPLRHKKLILQDGIYYFYQPSSAAMSYLFTYSHKAIHIMDRYDIDCLLALYQKEKKNIKDVHKRLYLLEQLVSLLGRNEELKWKHSKTIELK